MVKQMLLEIPGGATQYLKHVALMLKLLDDKAQAAALRGFIDLADSKLIREGTDGAPFHWMEDFLRSCRGSAPEMASRPPLTELRAADKDVMLSLLLDRDVYKSPPIGGTTRGVIVETDLANTLYRGWDWTPNGAAVDEAKDGVLVQIKSIDNVTSSTKSALEDAIIALSESEQAGTAARILDIRVKPGLGTAELDVQLAEFIELNPILVLNPASISITEYAF